MDVRQLKTILEERNPGGNANKQLTTISHWVKRIFDSDKGKHEAGDITEVDTLQKLADLGIVQMKKGSEKGLILAELTKEGRELYMDFMKLGYYL